MVGSMKRGDIFMAELNPVVGSEQGGRRPVLIIQNDLGNLHAPTVIAVPLTGSQNKPALPTHVHVAAGEGGLRCDSIVLCEQPRTLEKTRLLRHLGALPPATMRQVEQALFVSLDITCASSPQTL
ncbi:MAG: type II toxin-antitoxin system PemK/MazF family toxin [Clostridia bacterium]